MDGTVLAVGLFASSFGFAYLIYGKKRERPLMVMSGAILCIYPYFVSNTIVLASVAVVFILLPLFVHR